MLSSHYHYAFSPVPARRISSDGHDYDLLKSDLLQTSMNPADVIPAPRLAPVTPIIHNAVKQTAIVAPQNKVVFDEMQHFQQATEIVQTNRTVADTPTKRKIQLVKKFPIVSEQSATKIAKPIVTTASSDTILSAGTPFVINKANGNISGKRSRN